GGRRAWWRSGAVGTSSPATASGRAAAPKPSPARAASATHSGRRRLPPSSMRWRALRATAVGARSSSIRRSDSSHHARSGPTSSASAPRFLATAGSPRPPTVASSCPSTPAIGCPPRLVDVSESAESYVTNGGTVVKARQGARIDALRRRNAPALRARKLADRSEIDLPPVEHRGQQRIAHAREREQRFDLVDEHLDPLLVALAQLGDRLLERLDRAADLRQLALAEHARDHLPHRCLRRAEVLALAGPPRLLHHAPLDELADGHGPRARAHREPLPQLRRAHRLLGQVEDGPHPPHRALEPPELDEPADRVGDA